MFWAFWLFYGRFYSEIGAYEGKYCYSIFFGDTFAKYL